jgi:hypothetical protein
VPSEEDIQNANIRGKKIYEKLKNLTGRFKSKYVHGFDWERSQNLRKYRK